MDYNPAGSSVHGISRARILEWVTILFFRGSSQPRDRTRVSCITDSLLSELPGKPIRKMKSCINAHLWNLEKWYRWTYLRGRNRDTDIENRLVDVVGKGEAGTSGESCMETYVLPYVKQVNQWEFAVWLRELKPGLCETERGGMEVQEGGDIRILMADSHFVWQKPTQHWKAIILQLKIIGF